MTVCNMAIEAGARAGMVAVDDTTLKYVNDRPLAPVGEQWQQAVSLWTDLHSDADAVFDQVVTLKGEDIKPQVTWGTSPEMVLPVDGRVPEADEAEGYARALQYMGLTGGMKITDIPVDRVFIGSCTNSRIEDLREAAAVVKGRKVADTVKEALVVPGSGLIREQAEQEGLHTIFTEAGLQWREPGLLHVSGHEC